MLLLMNNFFSPKYMSRYHSHDSAVRIAYICLTHKTIQMLPLIVAIETSPAVIPFVLLLLLSL
jgi:hypothetical protein